MSSGKMSTKLDAHKSSQGKEKPKTTPKRKRMSDKVMSLYETVVCLSGLIFLQFFFMVTRNMPVTHDCGLLKLIELFNSFL